MKNVCNFRAWQTRIQKMWKAVLGVCCWWAADCEKKDEKRVESAKWRVSKMICTFPPCNHIYLTVIKGGHSLIDDSCFLHIFGLICHSLSRVTYYSPKSDIKPPKEINVMEISCENILTSVNSIRSTVTCEKFEVRFSNFSEDFLWFLECSTKSFIIRFSYR
jgi:hypothetical protein